jgi:hypothetical protein
MSGTVSSGDGEGSFLGRRAVMGGLSGALGTPSTLLVKLPRARGKSAVVDVALKYV